MLALSNREPRNYRTRQCQGGSCQHYATKAKDETFIDSLLDCHAESQYHYRGKESCPVTAADSGPRKQCKSARRDDWANSQRQTRAVMLDQSTGPTREQRDDENKRKRSRAGSRGGVALRLNQVQRQEEKCSSQCGIQKQR